MRAVVHGTGLIGASVGLALRAEGWDVAGWDPDPDALRAAADRGAVDVTYENPAQGVQETDLLVLAGPPTATAHALEELSTAALVTDVAGVKVPIVRAGRHLPHFVGGHPMAGREHTGPAFATASLFRGAVWVLTEDDADREDLDRLSTLVASFGDQPLTMPAADHDRAVARISHLPHVLAGALLRLATSDSQAFGLAAGSFRDVTRVAASEPGWWTEVLISNADPLADAIDELQRELASWREAVTEARAEALEEALGTARDARSRLGPAVVQVRVLLVDRPGELARVGRALETSGVDVRDLQLRHAVHGGAGVLTLAVRPHEAEALRAALTEQGFPPEE
jgi:prephenate dehydrogenase